MKKIVAPRKVRAFAVGRAKLAADAAGDSAARLLRENSTESTKAANRYGVRRSHAAVTKACQNVTAISYAQTCAAPTAMA
jgi:hypothetical protein